MTISTTIEREVYSGNGSATSFSVPFSFLKASNLVVILKNLSLGTETTQVLNTDYTVSQNTDLTGTVTMSVAPGVGYTLTILRATAQTQELALRENDALPVDDVETSLDKLTLLVQELQDKFNRTIALTDGYSSTFSTKLPSLLTPLYIPRINAAGNGFDLVNPADSAFAATLAQLFTGGSDGKVLTFDSTSPTSVTWARGPKVNVKDYGAKGDGSDDDSTAIQAALSALSPFNGGTCFFPAGTYIVSTPLSPAANTLLQGDGSGLGTTLQVKTGQPISTTIHSAVIQCSNKSGISIDRISFVGNGTWTSSSFSNPYSAGNSVGFTNDDYAIKFESTIVTSPYTSPTQNISISNCSFNGFSRGIVVNDSSSSVATAQNVTIRNCAFTNLGFGAIFLYTVDRFNLFGNYISGVKGNITAAGDTSTSSSKYGDGIGLNGARNGTVAQNVVTDFIRCGIIAEPNAICVTTGTVASGNANITSVGSINGVQVGMGISGTGIPVGAYVGSASGTTVGMVDYYGNALNATGSHTGEAISFYWTNSRYSLNNNIVTNQHSGVGSQDWAGIYVGDGFADQPAIISNNVVFNIFGSGTSYLGSSDGGDGIVATACHVIGGAVFNCNGNGLTDAGGGNSFANVRSYNNGLNGLRVIHNFTGDLTVQGCEFVNNGFSGALLAGFNGYGRIINSLFKDNGGLTTPIGTGHEGLGLSGITVAGNNSGPPTECLVIKGNTFISSVAPGSTVGQLYGISFQSSVFYNQFVKDNEFFFTSGSLAAYPTNWNVVPACVATYVSSSGYTCHDLQNYGNVSNKIPWTNDATQIGDGLRCLGQASAAPSSGTFQAGDFYYNNAVSGSNLKFVFVCTTAGTPGTWKTLTLA